MFSKPYATLTKETNELPLRTRIMQAFISCCTDDEEVTAYLTSIYRRLFKNVPFSQQIDPLASMQGCVSICGAKYLDIHDTMVMEMGAQEPWPQPIKLYQPYEVEQILLPDNANCLAVQAYLKMCGLEFQIEPRSNAEYMSPSGRVPFIQCGAFLVSEFDPIVSFINSKGSALSGDLSPTDKADMRAYICLVNNVLVNAEQYVCWVDQATLNSVTKPRHGSVYPWPLNHLLNWQKQHQITKKLNVLGWYNKTLDEVFGEVKNCCTALAERLEGKTYFFGDEPTELDALVYGHVHALTTTSFLSSARGISATIGRFHQLIEHSHLVKTLHFNKDSDLSTGQQLPTDNTSQDSLWDYSGSLESLPPLTEDSFTVY